MFYEVNLVTQEKNFYKIFKLVTRSVMSFSITWFLDFLTRFCNSRIPNFVVWFLYNGTIDHYWVKDIAYDETNGHLRSCELLLVQIFYLFDTQYLLNEFNSCDTYLEIDIRLKKSKKQLLALASVQITKET